MITEGGRRPMVGINENSFGDELEKEMGFLLHEQRRQDADDREKELNIYRSGSAPPTVEGSLHAVGGLFGNHAVRGGVGGGSVIPDLDLSKNGNGSMSEEELRSNPAYSSYYYSNVNLNPRLPPPLLSKEDWRSSQRVQGGSSAIGDRRKVNRIETGGRSAFAMPPGFSNAKNQESESEAVEWGGDGLIGLPGLGLGNKQKSLAEIFDDNGESLTSSETELAPSYSYAAALGGGLSRSTTPDPQHIARAPSPSLTPIGGGRVGSSEKRRHDNGTHSNESVDLVAALSGISLSNGISDPSPSSLHADFHRTGVPNRGLPFQYEQLDSPNSPYYGLGGHSMSPFSTQLGNSYLPPLFENAAASAMGMPGMDLRMLGGSMGSPGSDHGLSRMGNQMVDPMYLQYLRTANYAADRNYMDNSYVDLLQKAYRLSPQKSQYNFPSGGKNHGHYGNPSYGHNMSYMSPVVPTSPVGPGSPMHHNDFNMRFFGGVRNLSGGVMDNSFASSLLEEFKSNKTRSFELSEIAGHVVEFSADQYGSRFIQQKLETATVEEKNIVLQEIMPQALTLMTDVFGNYVIQKFFEHGMAAQRSELANKLFGHVLTLSLQMYGCRVIQKAIEVVDVDQKIKMVKELDGHIMRCVRDQNGNHVIQKCIECVPEDHIQFIISAFFGQIVTLSTHPYGCRVIQRVLEHCEDPATQSKVMEEVMESVSMLAQDQYGNYVIQHVLEHGKPEERTTIIQELAGKIVQMSQQKFASNVVEKCLTFGNHSERQLLMNEMLGSTDENEPLQAMMKDQFANYVVQKVLETCSDQERELILSRIKVHLNALKKYTYGKHIVARVEKLVTAGERRIAAQIPSPA